MKTIAATFVLLTLLAAGCARHTSSEPSAAPAYTTQATCEAAGGTWHGSTGTCEIKR